MKKLAKLIALSFIIFSCASVKTQKILTETPKTKGCNLEVFNNEVEIKKPFEVVCTIESKTGNSIWNRRTGEAAIELAKKAACNCGADAIVVTSAGQTKLKFYSYKRGIASLKAIKYN